MKGVPGANGSQDSAAVRRLREELEEDRRELAETITALHGKADVHGRLHDKAAGVEIAAADAVAWAGRRVGSLPRLPLVRRQLRLVLAICAAAAALIAIGRSVISWPAIRRPAIPGSVPDRSVLHRWHLR